MSGGRCSLSGVDGLGEWEVEFYADGSGREPCREWMGKLTAVKRIALEEAIRLVLVRRKYSEIGWWDGLGGGLRWRAGTCGSWCVICGC